MSSRWRRALIGSVAVALAPWLSHCGPDSGDGRERIALRLVAPELRQTAEPSFLALEADGAFPHTQGSAASLPVVTLREDTRPVLAAHARRLVAYRREIQADATGSWALDLELPDGFPQQETVVLEAVVGFGNKPWRRLDPVAARPRPGPDGRPHLVLEGSSSEPGGRGAATVWAIRAPRRTRYETRAISLPHRSVLELALGVAAATAGATPVRFTVEACEDEVCATLLDEELPAELQGCWSARRVDLGSVSSGVRRLRFSTRSSDPALAVFGDPRIVTPSERRPPPNLVLLSIDTLRADHLDLYGYARNTAPFLTAWASRDGTVFERAIAEATSTDPSHMTLFTGLPSLVHGVHSWPEALAVQTPTLASVLRSRGYDTAAFTEDGPLSQDRGFRIGFDTYVENKSPNLLFPLGQVARTFSQAREWLKTHGRRPFFLFLHTFQVHAPYAPPPAMPPSSPRRNQGSPKPSDPRGPTTQRSDMWTRSCARWWNGWRNETSSMVRCGLCSPITARSSESMARSGTRRFRTRPCFACRGS